MKLDDLTGISYRTIWGAQHAYDEVTGTEQERWADVRWADVHDFCRLIGVVDLLRTRNMGAVSILEIMEALAAHGLYLRPKVGDGQFVRQRMGGRRFREARSRILAMRRNPDAASPAAMYEVAIQSVAELATWYPG